MNQALRSIIAISIVVALGITSLNLVVESQRASQIIHSGRLNQATGLRTLNDGEALVANIPVGNDPQSLAFDTANNNLFVANKASNTITIVTGSSLHGSTATVATGQHPTG